MRKKMFIIVLSIMLMSLFTFVPNSVVGGYVEIANWDDLNVGTWEGYHKSIWFEKMDGDDFNVTDSQALSGSKSLQIAVKNWVGDEDDDDDGYINLTSVYNYCYGFEMDVRISFDDEEAGGDYGDVYIDFAFYDSSDTEVISMRWRDERNNHNRHLHFWDSLGSQHTLYNIPNDDFYNYTIGFYHVSGNTMYYYIDDYDTDTELASVEASCKTVADWQTYSYIDIHSVKEAEGVTSSGAYLQLFIDDLRFYTSGGAGSDQYGDVSGLTSFCSGSYYYSVLTTNKIVEQKFNVDFKGYIRCVDLYVNDDVTGFAPEGTESLGWYSLSINGETVGSPSYAIPSGENLIFRWIDFSINLDNEEPLFEFLANLPTAHLGSGGTYWDIFLSDNFELDDARWHDDLNQWGDGIWNGAYKTGTQKRPLAMCFYYDTYQENPSYNDNVQTEKSEYKEYENVLISGEVSTLSPDSYLRVYHDGVQFDRQGYDGLGKLITVGSNYNFQMSFVPDSMDSDGDWNVSIWRGGVMVEYSDNFTVVDLVNTQYNGLVWTYPNPSDDGETFNIGYRYNKSYFDNYNGALIISEFATFSDAYGTYTELIGEISGHGNMTYSIHDDGRYYIYLVVDKNGSFSPVFVHPHGVGLIWVNELNIEHDSVYLEEQSDGLTYAENRFTGYHSYYGQNVWLRINGIDFSSLRTKDNFDETIQFFESGVYHAELVKYDFSGELVLENGTFIVLEPYELTEQEQANEDFNMLLMLLFGVFLAIMVGIFAGASGSIVTFGGYVALFSQPDFTYSVFPVEVGYIVAILCGVILILFLLK